MSGFLQRIDWPPLLLSLKVASLATLPASIAGIALGWLFARRRFPGSAIVEAACMLPLVLPPTVIGYGILIVAGRRSAPGSWLHEQFGYTFVFNWHGAVPASTIVALPLVLKSASAAFAGVDRSLEAAARPLRQSPSSTCVRVPLPLAWPAILAGALRAVARAMGEFGATLMIAGDIPRETQTLSLAIYDAMQDGRAGTAFFLPCVTSGLSVAVLVLSKRFFTLR
ncbi:molybdate ABC transporter permease subunit [Burkholderia vietnamiensis]|uniref:molybdate ABC transporter permease subunit n=1 Tax=Burkholderia vietnamiensis TaxID=60552 RepID=UPI000D788C56|nr:molybdate ABC transporter permease subunit [Burkholderia vietnamiensis]GBH24227.1 molybdenum ABC transporter permease subunit [Burkholderia vietnamiensis]